MATTVVALEQQLEAARTVAETEKRDTASKEIQRLRGLGAELLEELRPLAAQVRQAQNERLNLNGQLIHARNQIAVYSTPIDPLNFPSDTEITEHRRQLRAWKQRQRELLEKHAECVRRESVRPQAVALQTKLDHLQYAINNLTAVAEGRTPGQVEGGLYGVEDFIGNMQTTHL